MSIVRRELRPGEELTDRYRFRRRIGGGYAQRLTDLNTARILTDTGSEPLADHGVILADESVEVVFRNHAERLIELIDEADVVVGCVAWLTHARILEALADKGVALIVQKEDFLRPDEERDRRSPGFAERLRGDYGRLRGLERYDFMGLIGSLSICGDPTFDPVRCVGVRNGEHASGPRAHNKFVVFCRPGSEPVAHDAAADPMYALEPYAVWTGSFNFTVSSTRSFENALVLRQPEIVDAYYAEFSQIAALSEPLDWTSPWVEPEWRIGT